MHCVEVSRQDDMSNSALSNFFYPRAALGVRFVGALVKAVYIKCLGTKPYLDLNNFAYFAPQMLGVLLSLWNLIFD